MKTAADIEAYIVADIEDITLGSVSAAEIRGDSRLIQDLGLDSMDYATVLLGCEKWLGIKIRERGVDWAELQTVNQLSEFLAKQQSS